MMVLFPFTKAQYPQLLDLLEWVNDLDENNLQHNALLVCSKDVDKGQTMGAVELCERSFGTVSAVQHKLSSDASGLFECGSQYIRNEACVPFIWCPVNCIPTKPGWIGALEKEYADAGKDYMRVALKETGFGVFPSDPRNVQPEQLHISKLIEFGGQPDRNGAVVAYPHPTYETIRVLRKKLNKERGASNNTFIQLGRYGDLMIVLRAMKIIYDQTGEKPNLVVSNVYAPLLDGVSYVTPFVITCNWWGGMPVARQFAQRSFGAYTILQCHADGLGCQMSRWSSYQASMWDRTGLDLRLMKAAPLVFDKRNKQREEQLVRKHIKTNKPVLLYNFTGVSSPFPHTSSVMKLLNDYVGKFEMVDIGKIRADRIYDMLGLYDAASIIIGIDSSPAHLCAGTKTPHIMFTVTGWTSSTPGGNCALEIKYDAVQRELHKISAVLNGILDKTKAPLVKS